jgi:hypothetical protein
MYKPSLFRRLLAYLLPCFIPKPSSRRPDDAIALYIANSFPTSQP